MWKRFQSSFHKDKKAPSMDDRRRVLLVGDAEGNLAKLYAQAGQYNSCCCRISSTVYV